MDDAGGLVRISLNRTGKRLLGRRHTLKVKLLVIQTLANRHTKTISTQKVTFKVPRKHP